MANAAFRLGEPPEKAIEYLKRKKQLAAKVFSKDLQASALARATTIARLTSAEMTKDIYQSLEDAVREGKPLSQWKKSWWANLSGKAGCLVTIRRLVEGLMAPCLPTRKQANTLAYLVG